MSIQLDEHFDATQDDVWTAITDPSELSAWFGGSCVIEPRVGGEVLFDVPGDGMIGAGVVRAFEPPRPDRAVALIEHTFVDVAEPDVASVCVWSVVKDRSGAGCNFHLTMDAPSRLADLFRPTVSAAATAEDARAALEAARSVLLVSWVLPEIPRTIAAAVPVVHAKTGPGPDDWAVLEPDNRAGDGFRAAPSAPPKHVDLVHLDWTLGFEEFVVVARELGAATFWYHSARTRPPAPADDRGCWVPPRQSAHQQAAVEAAGMAYIDSHYIVDVADRLTSQS